MRNLNDIANLPDGSQYKVAMEQTSLFQRKTGLTPYVQWVNK